MTVFNRLYKRIEQRIIQRADERDLLLAASRKQIHSPAYRLNYNAKTMAAKTIEDWKQAIAAATDPDSPDRTLLVELYDNLMLDNHLSSVIDSRILRVQRSPFRIVDDQGNENKALKDLLERPWLEQLIYNVMFSKFQGTTLLEFYDMSDMELNRVKEIPQTHFLPHKGLIVREPGDTRGWHYRSDAMADYYLQIGDNNDLGMLERLAPIVLAKKLGIGAWLDYIEKFGIPPIFIKTDREDRTRLDELFDAASNFRSNSFLIGRGQESFDIGDPGDVDAHNTFDKLIERANTEISKRILGQTMTTDSGSSRSQAEVHERVADDRHESDKLFFKFIFNKDVIPRLVKLSPLYAGFEKHKWEWDNTESMNIASYIDAVSKLAASFTLDADAIAKRTGIPVLDTKNKA